MTAAEWIALAAIIMTLLVTIGGGVAGLIWWFITRDAQRIEKGMEHLTSAVNELVLEIREIKVDVRSLHEDKREMQKSFEKFKAEVWIEINRIKDRTRDTWRPEDGH